MSTSSRDSGLAAIARMEGSGGSVGSVGAGAAVSKREENRGKSKLTLSLSS